VGHAIVTPSTGPLWQRVALVALVVVEVAATLLVLSAGAAATAFTAVVFVAAVLVAAAAPGNRTLKAAVLGVLGALLIVALASFAWA